MAGSGRGARHSLPAAAVVAGMMSILLAAAAPPAAAQSDPHPPHRLFLVQGGDLVIRGDYVRIGDRIVFLLPLHADEAVSPSQLVSVPAAAVDWGTTRQYAAGVRAVRRAAAGSSADRRTQEAVDIVALLDDAPAADTDADGDLSVSLIATASRPQPLPILPAPSLQEIIARALAAARLTPVPEERLPILHAALAVLDDPHSALGAEWRAVTRAIAARDLAAEARRAAADERRRQAALRAWYAGLRAAVDAFAATRSALDDIRSAARPSLAVLATTEQRLQDAADGLAGHEPPAGGHPAHDLLRQAFRLASAAAQQRLHAVGRADARAAWDSAAAAAGALMLFDRAAALLDRSLPATGPN